MATLDLENASKLLKMHPQTVLGLARSGELPGAKPGKCWVFIEEDLIEWLRSKGPTMQPSQDFELPSNWELFQQHAEAMCLNFPNRYYVPKTHIKIDKYHVYRSLATPRWLSHKDRMQMRALYKQTAGTGLSVDHIIPLRGRNVCGLHVPWNLRLIPIRENQRKNNIYVPVG